MSDIQTVQQAPLNIDMQSSKAKVDTNLSENSLKQKFKSAGNNPSKKKIRPKSRKINNRVTMGNQPNILKNEDKLKQYKKRTP